MRQTQFFEKFVYSDNTLITNILCLNLPFLPSKILKNPLTFKFLFKHSSKARSYTLLNISTEANCLFLRSPLFFSLQRAVFKFSAHSERICSALY